MRAIWTGAIGFGLVNIPVRIFSATQDSNLDLDMLDKKIMQKSALKESMKTVAGRSAGKILSRPMTIR